MSHPIQKHFDFLNTLATCNNYQYSVILQCSEEEQRRAIVDTLANIHLFCKNIPRSNTFVVRDIVKKCTKPNSNIVVELTRDGRRKIVQSLLAAILRKIYSCELIKIIAHDGTGDENN